MTTRSLHLAKDLAIPLNANPETQTYAVLAKRGVGKTYTAAVFAEELLKAERQVVVIDPIGVWHGLRSSADGKHPGLPIIVMGGDHGDVPLEVAAGSTVADFLVEHRASVVLDLSRFRKGEQTRFMEAFAETLYHKNRQPVMVIVDEADAFAPQRPQPGDQRLLGAMEDLVRRGRARGIGLMLVTQRAAVLNKNVLTQVEVLVVLRTIAPQDRDAIDAWVKVYGTEEQRAAFMASLATLAIGEAWLWSPGWLELFQRIHVRRRETFDSSATPKAGDKVVTPKERAAVDLEALKVRIAATIEKAKQDDPRELRKQIAELKKQAADFNQRPSVKAEVKTVEKFVLKDGQLARVEKIIERLEQLRDRVADHEEDLNTVAREIRDAIAKTRERAPVRVLTTTRQTVRQPMPAQASRSVPVARSSIAAAGALTEPQRRILDVVGMLEQRGIDPDRECVAAWLDLHPRGGSYGENLGALRAAGHLDGWRLTDSGRALARPMDTGVDAALVPLTEPQRRLLMLVVSQNGAAHTRESAAEALGLHPRGGSYGENIARLRTMGLLEPRGDLVATKGLFA